MTNAPDLQDLKPDIRCSSINEGPDKNIGRWNYEMGDLLSAYVSPFTDGSGRIY